MSDGPGGVEYSEGKTMTEERAGRDSYTPTEAALILRVTPTRVRQLLQDDELEGHRDEAGHWLIPARAVHERAERAVPGTEAASDTYLTPTWEGGDPW